MPTAATPAPAVPAQAPEAAPAGPPTAGANAERQQPAGEVIVIQVRQVKLWAWVIAGGMIGAMLAGALVVPFFGEELVLLGSVSGAFTIFVSAWIGMRLGRAAVGR